MMLLADGRVFSVVLWSAVLLVLLGVGLVWGMRFKRRMTQEDDGDAPPMGFTLGDLRRMHRAGQLNDAEFAKAKDKIIEAAKKAAERPAPAAGAKGAARLSQRGFDVLPPDAADPGAGPKR